MSSVTECRVKIVLISSGSPEYDRFPNGGGIQHQIRHTAEELASRGHDPIVVTRDSAPELPQGVRSECIDVVLTDEIGSRIEFSRRAVEALPRIDPDVVFTYERFSALFPCRGPYPTLFFTSNYDAMTFYKSYAFQRHPANHPLFPIKRRIEEYVMRCSDRVIALNTELEEYLHGRGITHTSTVPNGVDSTAYQNRGEDDFILYAGRLSGVKNVQLLIDTFETIASDYPDLTLRFTGDGEERGSLEQQVHERGLSERVEFTGWVDRSTLHEYFGRCQVFVLPSDFETFGIVVLEAMASGKPVVASDTMGPRSIISDGEDGVLFQPSNSDALRHALERLLSSPERRSRLGTQAMTTVRESYAFSEIAERLLTISQELIASQTPDDEVYQDL